MVGKREGSNIRWLDMVKSCFILEQENQGGLTGGTQRKPRGGQEEHTKDTREMDDKENADWAINYS